MATSGLLVGTFAGVYRFVDQVPKVAALRDNVITHLSVGASGRVAAAAVPVLGPVHNMYKAQQFASGEQLSGVHLLHLPGEEAASAGVPESQWVWRGDARSCLVWEPPPPPPSDGQGAAPVGLAAGTEPADVFCSLDGGRSWSAGSHGFAAAPSRGDWSFPAPPHKPHVLSLEALPPAQSPAASPPSPTRGVHDPAAALAQQPELAAGIEVGGVLVGGRRGGGPDGADAWQERNGGLYPDIHSCRIDPHDPRHWLAVTGAGRGAGGQWGRAAAASAACQRPQASPPAARASCLGLPDDGCKASSQEGSNRCPLPGCPAGRGLYATRDAGASWQRQCPEVWAGRYTVGLAFNPERQARGGGGRACVCVCVCVRVEGEGGRAGGV
jgi:hypothetical protein